MKCFPSYACQKNPPKNLSNLKVELSQWGSLSWGSLNCLITVDYEISVAYWITVALGSLHKLHL